MSFSEAREPPVRAYPSPNPPPSDALAAGADDFRPSLGGAIKRADSLRYTSSGAAHLFSQLHSFEISSFAVFLSCSTRPRALAVFREFAQAPFRTRPEGFLVPPSGQVRAPRRVVFPIYVCISIYDNVYKYIYIYIYVYIYIEREIDRHVYVCVYIYIHTCMHIHIYIYSIYSRRVIPLIVVAPTRPTLNLVAVSQHAARSSARR